MVLPRKTVDRPIPQRADRGIPLPIPRSITSAPIGDLDMKMVSGAWPPDLRGEMVISAPEPRSELPYCLFGFGAMIRLSLQPGTHGAPSNRFALRAKVIDTPSKRLFDKTPGEFAPQVFGYSSPFGPPNQVNTAPLPWGDRLFATWDVGRPVEIDPITLGFLGDVGHRDGWGEATLPLGSLLPFYFSSAHPVVDADRDLLFTVKLFPTAAGSMQLNVVCWTGEGHDVRRWPIAHGTVSGSAHTVSQTRDWLILADSGNFKTDMGEILGGQRTVTIDEGAPVYLIRKDHLLATPSGVPFTPRFFSVAPTTGHFFGCWDDEDGVRVLFEHMDLMDLGFRLGPGDLDANGRPLDPEVCGFYNTAMAPSTISEWSFDLVSGASERTAAFRDDWTWNLELSGMDWSTEGMAHPTLHHVAYQGFRPGAVSHRALEIYRSQGRVGELPADDTPGVLATFRRGALEVHSSWTYHDTGDHITSPIFAPRAAGHDPRRSRYSSSSPGGHDGYVVLPVLSDEGFRVEVFDADRVGDGPIAVIAAPGGECLPAMLHAAWMPEVAAVTDHERLSFGEEVDWTHAESFGTDLHRAVVEVAADLDAALAAT